MSCATSCRTAEVWSARNSVEQVNCWAFADGPCVVDFKCAARGFDEHRQQLL